LATAWRLSSSSRSVKRRTLAGLNQSLVSLRYLA
jgi:hypothetical protein